MVASMYLILVCCLETMTIYIFQKLKTGVILCADEGKTTLKNLFDVTIAFAEFCYFQL